jgi:acetolactate synthase-1/2/3 large subunit
MSGSEPSVAELMVRCLENEGVTHVFGIPGEENIHLVEALSRVVDPLRAGPSRAGRVVHGRDLRPAHRPAGVCSATLGPGAINLLLGTADATTNSTPLVALSAQVACTGATRSPTRGWTWCRCSRR